MALSLTLALFCPKELIYQVLSKCWLNFISCYCWKQPHLLFGLQRQEASRVPPSLPPAPVGLMLLIPGGNESSKPLELAVHPATHPSRQIQKEETPGTWARETVATLITSECPLWAILGSGPASDHRHSGIYPSSLGPESELESEASLCPMMDVADVAAFLVSWGHRKRGGLW